MQDDVGEGRTDGPHSRRRQRAGPGIAALPVRGAERPGRTVSPGEARSYRMRMPVPEQPFSSWASSKAGRQPGALGNGALGVEFGRHVRAANEVGMPAGCLERLEQGAQRHLAGANHDRVHGQ